MDKLRGEKKQKLPSKWQMVGFFHQEVMRSNLTADFMSKKKIATFTHVPSPTLLLSPDLEPSNLCSFPGLITIS